MEIKEMRRVLGDTQRQFAERYKIPLRTLQDWESGKRNCPSYMELLLERAVERDYKS